MKYKAVLAITLGAAAMWACPAPTEAGERRGATRVVHEGALQPTKARYKRKRAVRVYGYSTRRGGYSYSTSDVVNTYGLTRNKYGSTNSFRDPAIDRQTGSGPFDHGFFFDSAIGPRGGDSPYLH
mgnify:CR=1 FL=1